MITFSPTTYGKDTAVRIPELDGLEKSVQRRGEMSIRAEELKLERALANKKEFDKALEVDPVSAISKANTIRQALAIEKYNNAVAGLYAKNNGELTYADQIAVANAKNDLRSFQDRLLAEENEYKEAKDIVDRDVRGYYDPQYFKEAQMNFLTNGEMPKGGFLSVNAINPASFLAKLPAMGETTDIALEDVTDAKGNVVGRKEVQYKFKMTENQAKEQIFASFAHEPAVKGYIRDFQSLPETEQYKWLKDYDKNANGVVDPAERQFAYSHMDMRSNPIVQWAMQNPGYLDAAKGKEALKATNIPGTGSSNNRTSFSYGTGARTYYTPTASMQTKLGSTPLSKYHSFGQFETYTIPAENIEIQNVNGNKEKSVVKNLTVLPTGYDEDRDIFTFTVKQNYRAGNTEGNGDQIAISRASLPPEFNDIKIVVDGKIVRIGDMAANKSSKPTKGALDNL